LYNLGCYDTKLTGS